MTTTAHYLTIALFALSLIGCSRHYMPGRECSLASMVDTVPTANRLIDKDWNIWCGSMTKGFDQRYHLYFSRWEQQTGHEAWISHSEICYAVADKPEGPYRFVNVALPPRAGDWWDAAMTHNPYVVAFRNKYYLYYIATQGNVLSADQTLRPYGTEWWQQRNTQRIGVAVADKPEGPWERFDQPLLSVNQSDSTAFDALCVTNPAVCAGRNNQFVMLYKAVCKNGSLRGGNVRFSVAFADSPTGEFVKTNRLIFESDDPNDMMFAEDPYIWFDKRADRYYAIVRDVTKKMTGKESGGLALMESYDAIEWHVTPNPKVLPAQIAISDGSSYDASTLSFERPCLYINNKGVPELLFGACSIPNGNNRRYHSFNMFVPLKQKRSHEK